MTAENSTRVASSAVPPTASAATHTAMNSAAELCRMTARAPMPGKPTPCTIVVRPHVTKDANTAHSTVESSAPERKTTSVTKMIGLTHRMAC